MTARILTLCPDPQLLDSLEPFDEVPREVIAPSLGDDEFVERLPNGLTVHRVAPRRSYVLKLLSPLKSSPAAFFARAAEKIFELNELWNIEPVRVELNHTTLWKTQKPTHSQTPKLYAPVQTAELICCTYNRVDELLISFPSLIAATEKPTIVFQNEDFAEHLFKLKPEWRSRLHLIPSFPPSLPRARNEAIKHSKADLLIFVDDDVELEPGFVNAYIEAANQHREAAGFVGRIRSRHEGRYRENTDRAVGHMRLSGYVDANFDSAGDGRTQIVPHTPRGANMAFRREPFVQEFGTRWFDEALPGSAHREESTLALEAVRRGLSFVHVPSASLYHFESEQGGCENRSERTDARVLTQLTLDQLFLRRLYEPFGPFAALWPLLTTAREVKHAQGLRERLRTARLAVRAYSQGASMYRQRPWPNHQ